MRMTRRFPAAFRRLLHWPQACRTSAAWSFTSRLQAAATLAISRNKGVEIDTSAAFRRLLHWPSLLPILHAIWESSRLQAAATLADRPAQIPSRRIVSRLQAAATLAVAVRPNSSQPPSGGCVLKQSLQTAGASDTASRLQAAVC